MTANIEVWADNATGTLGAPAGPTPTPLVLSVAQTAGVFPTLSAGEVFHLVIDFGTTNAEIVEVTATSGSDILGWIFTLASPGCVNNHNGPPGGAQVALVITKEGLDNMLAESVVLSTFTTAGDTIYGTGPSAVTRLPIGSDTYVYTVVSGVPAWVTPGAPPTGSAGGDLGGTYPDPTITSLQGIVISGTPTAGDGLYATGASTAAWSALDAAQIESGFTTAGELFVGTGAGTGELLEYSADGDILVGASGLPAWTTAAAVVESGFTTAGELFVGTGAGTGELLAIGGTPGDVLTVGGSGLPAWATPALTYSGEVASGDVSLPTGVTTVLTTDSLANGTWLITMTACIELGAASTGQVSIALAVGTASAATRFGPTSAEVPGGIDSEYISVSFTCIVIVTSPGTLVMLAENGDPSIAATTRADGGLGVPATGYTAVKIA